MSDQTCYRCGQPVPEGQTECDNCARGMPPGMAQMGEMLAGLKFVEIDWDKIRSLPEAERTEAIITIVSTAIPAVVRNSPQYFKILKYIKT